MLAVWKQRYTSPFVNDRTLNEGGSGNRLHYRYIFYVIEGELPYIQRELVEDFEKRVQRKTMALFSVDICRRKSRGAQKGQILEY